MWIWVGINLNHSWQYYNIDYKYHIILNTICIVFDNCKVHLIIAKHDQWMGELTTNYKLTRLEW